MTISILKSIIDKVKLASDDRYTSALKLGLEQKQSLNYNIRKKLEGSIHVFEKKLLVQYLKEYLKSSNTAIDYETVDRAADLIFGKTLVLLGNRCVVNSTKDALVICKVDTHADPKALKAFKLIATKPSMPLSKDIVEAIYPYLHSSGYSELSEELKNVRDWVKHGMPQKGQTLAKDFLMDLVELGHANISSVATFETNMFVVDGYLDSQEDKDALNSLYSVMSDSDLQKKILNNFSNTIINEIKMDKALAKQLFSYMLDGNLELIRQLNTNEHHFVSLDLNLSGSPAQIQERMFEAIDLVVKKHVTYLAPQNKELNGKLGREIEKKVRTAVPILYNSIYNEVNKLIKSNTRTDLVNLKGSKSMRELIKDSVSESITESLKTGIPSKIKPKKVVSKTKTVGTTGKNSTAKSTGKKGSVKSNSKSSLHAPKIPQLRDTKGHFTSPTKLQTLMQQMLHDTIKDNMQRPNLHYQSGRFAKSVKVEGITRARDGALTAFLSYMRYPYATFEAGGAQGHKGYYPSRLINQSAREIAMKLTKERFTAVTVK